MASQQELINIVNGLIIDNNTNQVTPAKVRSALISIIEELGVSDATSVAANLPLVLDPFTNTFSINKATFEVPGVVKTNTNILDPVVYLKSEVDDLLTLKIYDEVLTAPKQSFAIDGICEFVTINDSVIPKSTSNNSSRVARWSQASAGAPVILTKTTATNNYIYILYK